MPVDGDRPGALDLDATDGGPSVVNALVDSEGVLAVVDGNEAARRIAVADDANSRRAKRKEEGTMGPWRQEESGKGSSVGYGCVSGSGSVSGGRGQQQAGLGH